MNRLGIFNDQPAIASDGGTDGGSHPHYSQPIKYGGISGFPQVG
ncbi:MAG TPA: hypothetical protein VF018_01770 [Acidobacteriaceae bacterium]